MAGSVHALFVTQVFEDTLTSDGGFVAFNSELKSACDMVAAEDGAGRAWCRANGYRGYTSYGSLTDLPQRASVFGELKRKLDRRASPYADALGFEPGGRRLKLDSLWVNVLAPGGAHSGHIHPNSVLSGTVYVEVPGGSGALRLEDPRLPLMMAAPAPRKDAPEAQQRFIHIAPKAGTVLMWESWLRHEVMPNKARTPRISLSFNYS